MMTETLTDALRRRNRAIWDGAVSHRFVSELFEGSIDDSVMAGYLVQDYRFLDHFLVLLGSAVSTADSLSPRLRLAVLVVVEWLYLSWAMAALERLPKSFLRAELDRVGPAHRALVEDFFGRAISIELAFFDASYAHPREGAGR